MYFVDLTVQQWYHYDCGGMPVARKRKAEKTIQSTMRLPVSLWEAINRIAERKRVSMQWCVVQSVIEFVEREEKPHGRKS